jgi:hypothetical protein
MLDPAAVAGQNFVEPIDRVVGIVHLGTIVCPGATGVAGTGSVIRTLDGSAVAVVGRPIAAATFRTIIS